MVRVCVCVCDRKRCYECEGDREKEREQWEGQIPRGCTSDVLPCHGATRLLSLCHLVWWAGVQQGAGVTDQSCAAVKSDNQPAALNDLSMLRVICISSLSTYWELSSCEKRLKAYTSWCSENVCPQFHSYYYIVIILFSTLNIKRPNQVSQLMYFNENVFKE